MDIWEELGFRDNPFSTNPIPPSEEGARLLVGREPELKRLRMLLTSSTNHATIEGANGVGKTILVGIAAFSLLKSYEENTARPMFLPVAQPFQISPSQSAREFSNDFFITIGRELSSKREWFDTHKSSFRNLPDIDMWLNDPILKGGGFGGTALGFGANGNVSRTANTGSGFNKGGLEAHLREMLLSMFPHPKNGGFVCVLDNLELLDTSEKARATLEELRDGVLAFPGIKWVLCGARGILRSVVSPPACRENFSPPLN